MGSLGVLPMRLECRRAQLGVAATGRELIEEFFNLARVAIDGYLAPDSEDDVVRVEADSPAEYHTVDLKRQLTWLDAENAPGLTHFYLDMSFERRSQDQPLNWFTINHGAGPVVDQDVNLAAVARALLEHGELQRILAGVPRTVRTWVDGDLAVLVVCLDVHAQAEGVVAHDTPGQKGTIGQQSVIGNRRQRPDVMHVEFATHVGSVALVRWPERSGDA